MLHRTFGLLVCAASCAMSWTAGAENWPQWRGPQGNGITGEVNVVTHWDRETNVRWRRPLPEPGNSSPVAWGDRIFLTQPESNEGQPSRRTLICLDRKDGQILWQSSVDYAEEEATHRTNFYCSSSPATDGERVIVWFGSAGLVCYDFEGEETWRRDLGPQKHMWGYGTSPILYENLCILSFGPGQREFLIAVDKRTGEDVWRVESLPLEEEQGLSGPENDGNADPEENAAKPLDKMLRGSWGTPILADVDDHVELIVAHPRRVTGYDPAEGTPLWTCGGLAPLVYTSPIYGDGVVVAAGGYSGASLAVRPGGSDDVTDSRRLWHVPRTPSNRLGTGVIHEGHLFIGDMDGIVHCHDVRTGQRIWRERLPATGGRGHSWSSITMTADGLAYLLNKSGDTIVFHVTPSGYEQVAKNALGEPSNSTVVISQGDVLVRTHEALWCLGK